MASDTTSLSEPVYHSAFIHYTSASGIAARASLRMSFVGDVVKTRWINITMKSLHHSSICGPLPSDMQYSIAPRMARWCNEYSIWLTMEKLQIWLPVGHCYVVPLGKVFTPSSFCHQCNFVPAKNWQSNSRCVLASIILGVCSGQLKITRYCTSTVTLQSCEKAMPNNGQLPTYLVQLQTQTEQGIMGVQHDICTGKSDF